MASGGNRGMIRSAAVLLFAFPFAPAFAAVSFDVASIKINSGNGEVNNKPATDRIVLEPGGVTMTNVTLTTCIKTAYNVYSHQIEGPAWLDTARFDIAGKSVGPVKPDQLRLMLQTLLAERFHVTLHHKNKEIAVYSLEIGKRGQKLRVASEPGDKSMQFDGGSIRFRNYTIQDLIATLAGVPFRIDRPIQDKTGLEGRYDFELKVADDMIGMKHAFEGMLRGSDDGPSLTGLIQDQLGLRFNAEKASVDVLVLDTVDRLPVAN